VSAPLEDADVETASLGYAGRFDSSVGRWMLERQLSATLALLPDPGPLKILDVGGGHGQTATALAERGHHVSILASSPKAVNPTLQKAVDAGTVTLIVGDLRQPPVEPRAYDVVLSYRLLAHAYDLDGLVSGLTSTASRCVVVDYATSRSFNALADLFFAAKKQVEKNTRPFRVMSDLAIATAFGKCGFRAAGRRPQFFWPMALHRALGLAPLARALEAPPALLGLRAFFGSPVIARFDRD